jgi:hypothetical protein
MGPGLAAMDHGRRYRLADARVSSLLAVLDRDAELLGADGQTELTFEGGRPAAGRVTLRFRVGQEFGELQVSGADGRTTDANVYAAGPIERILHAIGFHEISRALVLAQRYRFKGAEIRVAHVTPLGWFCEIKPAAEEDLPAIMAALGQSPSPAAERRAAARRAAARRAQRTEFDGAERRTTPDRRLGDRRLTAAT